MSTATGVGKPYDWDNYRSDFHSSPAYEQQETQLLKILGTLYSKQRSGPAPYPKSILEVGPGFGRITSHLVNLFPKALFALSDLSESAIEETSAALPQISFACATGPLQSMNLRHAFPITLDIDHQSKEGDRAGGFDLVVAIEVLLHIPSEEVSAAIYNLLTALAPTGVLITCDWTKALPGVAIRNQNFRHDYHALFAAASPPNAILTEVPTGLQTIYVVQRVAPVNFKVNGRLDRV